MNQTPVTAAAASPKPARDVRGHAARDRVAHAERRERDASGADRTSSARPREDRRRRRRPATASAGTSSTPGPISAPT